MPLFVCEKCGCVDNTALGFYWGKFWPNKTWFVDDSYNGKALCSECCPKVYVDGSETGKGKWHNMFPKQHVYDYVQKRGWKLFKENCENVDVAKRFYKIKEKQAKND